jgi:tripartite-type tricarboxylate transporter receptor subunit TctC
MVQPRKYIAMRTSTSHFSAEMFNRKAGIQMAHVPYKGTAAGIRL